MEGYRSRTTYGDVGMDLDVYDRRRSQYPSCHPHGGSYDYDSRSCGTVTRHQFQGGQQMKMKKGKDRGGGGGSSSLWCFNDPEMQRKKRVASYKVYSVEGKMKGSFRKGIRWLKQRYTRIVDGWW